jgi:lipid II:glycine glycyltransferase (peptidoglycan interpeptide bridge formation enzyme)
LLFVEENQPLAAAQILQRKLSRTPLSVTYVPKGPVLDFDDTSLLVQVLSTLEQFVRKQRGLFVKIDPTVWLGTGPEDSPPSLRTDATLNVLEDRGWRQSNEQIQFKNSVIIDLTPDEDQLLSNMKAKTRYNIRLTIRAIQVMERSQWDAALASLPTAHALQTWDWGDFKSRWGWESTRYPLSFWTECLVHVWRFQRPTSKSDAQSSAAMGSHTASEAFGVHALRYVGSTRLLCGERSNVGCVSFQDRLWR